MNLIFPDRGVIAEARAKRNGRPLSSPLSVVAPTTPTSFGAPHHQGSGGLGSEMLPMSVATSHSHHVQMASVVAASGGGGGGGGGGGASCCCRPAERGGGWGGAWGDT